ncbi:MAG: hypothetical protein ACKOWN_02405 [Microbacteriaceae bacterium]
MWEKFRDARTLGAIGVLVFVAFIGILNLTVYTPEATVLRYLSALGDGRVADVERIANGEIVSPPHVAPIPSDPADRPHNARIVQTHSMPGMVVVTAEVELAGVTEQVDFVLMKIDTWLPLNEWVFAGLPVARVDINSTGDSSGTINGEAVTGTGLAFVPTVSTIGAQTPWFEAPEKRVPLVDIDQYEVDLKVKPTAALTEALDTSLHDYLDGCAAHKVLVPAKCPFTALTSMTVAAGPDWKIETYPTLSITEKDGAWLVTGNGTARLTVSLIDFATEKTNEYSEPMQFTISATIAGIRDGAPRLVVANTVED